MKTEDRILELLAEYLKKTDQTIERIDGANKRMDLAYDVLVKHSEELVELRKSSEKNQQEIVELRKESIKHEIQQDVLLKEILSISRRVGTLEDKR
jgi:hypothetical protein